MIFLLVYTTISQMQIYDRVCLNKRKECTIQYSGHQDAMHNLTSHAAAGDKIGWDFTNTVTKCQVSLSAYCALVSKRYCYLEMSFMRRSTFTDFTFSWLANLNVDFHQTWRRCGTEPKIFACDGTKIGTFSDTPILLLWRTQHMQRNTEQHIWDINTNMW